MRPSALKNNHGFSLIELMMVIAIISALASIALPNYLQYREKAYGVSCLSNRRHIEINAKARYAEDGDVEPELIDIYTCPRQGIYVWMSTDPGSPEFAKVLCSIHSIEATDPDQPQRVTIHSGSFADSTFDDLTNSDNWTVSDDGIINSQNYNMMLLEGSDCSDFEATVTATLVSGNGWGFFYRATPNEDAKQKVDGYTFQLDPGAGDRFLVKDAATDKTIASVKIKDVFGSSFDMNAEHTFSIDVVGDQHTIVVDGKTALSFTDDRYESGQTGFRTWRGETEFSDLELIQK